jgi:hypothetical protein
LTKWHDSDLTGPGPDCRDVLPGHVGQLHGVLADWWLRRWSTAGPAGAAAGCGGVSYAAADHKF